MLFGRRKRQITRLLVVEDEPLIAFDTEHLLTDADYEIVATVDRVADAVQTLRSGAAVDLVLVDISLSDGSGIAVAQTAREQGVAVLFVSGQCPPEAEAVGDGWLSKPYAQRDLLGAITAIEERRAGRAQKRMPAGFRLFTPAE